MPFKPCFALFILMLFGKSGQAQAEKVPLSVQPKTCVVQTSGDICAVKVNIHWRSLTPLTRCLLKNKQQHQCWYRQHNVSDTLLVDIKNSQNFVLVNEENEILVQEEVKLTTYEPKQYRRRLRADWSLF